MAWDNELEDLVRTTAVVLGEETLDEAVARAISVVTRHVSPPGRRTTASMSPVSQDRFYETLREELTRVLRPQ